MNRLVMVVGEEPKAAPRVQRYIAGARRPRPSATAGPQGQVPHVARQPSHRHRGPR